MALPITYAGTPTVLSERNPKNEHEFIEDNQLDRPFSGQVWWNSLYWTNFPILTMCDAHLWEQYQGSAFYRGIGKVNSDGCLAEQYITFGAAREDLCRHTAMPSGGCTLKVECMQYEGHRVSSWSYPLAGYLPKRDNHGNPEVQARRFQDPGVVHLGLNGADFSEKIGPVSDLDAHIMVNDYSGNPTHGYFHCLLRVNGWPFKVERIGTYEVDNAPSELKFGIHHFDESLVWQMLEGGVTMAPTGPNGEVEFQGNQMIGTKFYAQLFDFDNMGPKINDSKMFDPEVPQEKGYVWFTVVDTITVPSTGKKGVKVQLLDEGIVPAWLDLTYLQVWAGGVPCGHLQEADVAASPAGRVSVLRCPRDGDDRRGARKVVVENLVSKLTFDDPVEAQHNDIVDMGWAIHDCCYLGCEMRVGPRPGEWADAKEVGFDEGFVVYSPSGPPKLYHDNTLTNEKLTQNMYQRKLVR